MQRRLKLVYYKDFISKLSRYIGDVSIDSSIIEDMKEKLLKKKNSKKVEYEDLAPLIYIANRIRGTEKQINLKSIHKINMLLHNNNEQINQIDLEINNLKKEKEKIMKKCWSYYYKIIMQNLY